MGTTDIILIIITALVCISGGYIAIKSLIDTRNRNIKQFYKNRDSRRKEFENG